MRILDNLIWMRNRAWHTEIDVPRMMFYHIPKTGGLYLYNALSSALLLLSNLAVACNPGFRGFASGRIDQPGEMDQIKDLWLVGTHLPYGWHLDYAVSPAPKLFTLLRDPFERVLSNYTYNCMRSGILPEPEAFMAYARQPENCNLMVRYFCGGGLGIPT